MTRLVAVVSFMFGATVASGFWLLRDRELGAPAPAALAIPGMPQTMAGFSPLSPVAGNLPLATGMRSRDTLPPPFPDSMDKALESHAGPASAGHITPPDEGASSASRLMPKPGQPLPPEPVPVSDEAEDDVDAASLEPP